MKVIRAVGASASLVLSALASLWPINACAAEDLSALSKALTFHASFDHGFDADFSLGGKEAKTRGKSGLVPTTANEDLQQLAQGGRFGGCLHFPKKGANRPQFNGAQVLHYNDSDWSATVSIWLKLDPDKDLEPGYCDPVQIVGDDTKKGFIFLEWSKNETPRFFRFAVRPLLHLWNPNNIPWDQLAVDKRPMVQVARAPFSREQWTHAVFSLEHLNHRGLQPSAHLYLNGQKAGSITGWDLTFGWNPNAVELVLGASYIGHMDDLAIFNKALSPDEVATLHGLPNGASALHPKP